MINDDEKYYYVAIKNKLELYSFEWLRGKKESIINKDNCFPNDLNDSLDYQKIKDVYVIIMINFMQTCRKKVKYSPRDKSLNAPFIIYADLECLLKKKKLRQNNPKNSYMQRKAKHRPSGYSLSLICLFNETKNRQNFYEGIDKKSKYALYRKVRDRCHYTGKVRGTAHNICNLRYKYLKKFPQYFIMVQH